MKHLQSFNIPILFLIFNRLDTTKQVFEIIRKAAPQNLYIASDGPRNDREGESKRVESVREYVLKSIDWDCKVKTLFREKNFGCGKAVSSAITWFFKEEEMGIILEDDCLPSFSFFPYCEELLNKYKEDTRIYHIAGYNPLINTKESSSYYFTRIQHCWGWASWRRAWNHYNFDITDLNMFQKQKKINHIFKRSIDRYYWSNIFKRMEKHEINTWDHQWTYSILKNNGICINPTKNFISNIGFGADATHTTIKNSNQNNQQRFEIDKIVHPDKIMVDKYMIKINKDVFGINWLWYCKNRLKLILKKIF